MIHIRCHMSTSIYHLSNVYAICHMPYAICHMLTCATPNNMSRMIALKIRCCLCEYRINPQSFKDLPSSYLSHSVSSVGKINGFSVGSGISSSRMIGYSSSACAVQAFLDQNFPLLTDHSTSS